VEEEEDEQVATPSATIKRGREEDADEEEADVGSRKRVRRVVETSRRVKRRIEEADGYEGDTERDDAPRPMKRARRVSTRESFAQAATRSAMHQTTADAEESAVDVPAEIEQDDVSSSTHGPISAASLTYRSIPSSRS
jgi:hypothetical protein